MMRLEVYPDATLVAHIEAMLARVYGRIESDAVETITHVMARQTREAFCQGLTIAVDICEQVEQDGGIELEDEGLRMRQRLEDLRDAAAIEDEDSRAQPPREDSERREGTNQA